MLNSKFPSIVEAVTALIKKERNLKSHVKDAKRISKRKLTLKREPIDENLDDLVASSRSGGKSPATKEHFDVLNKS